MRIALFLLLASTSLLAQPETPPILTYDIEAQLDPEKKLIIGALKMIYTNASPDIIPDLRFHAYYNASANSGSTFNREAASWLPNEKARFGYMNIIQTLVNGEDQSQALVPFIEENSFDTDRTVYNLPLQSPLMPGQSLEVSMTFEAKVPKSWERTGYMDDYFLIAHWFPKLGVWETRGFRDREEPGWNCHAFHNDTEFFANYANYRVSITAPSEFKIGATGVLRDVIENGTTSTHIYEQDWVHEFAFVAWPEYLVFEKTWNPADIDPNLLQSAAFALGKSIDEIRPRKPVQMKLFLAPEHEGQEDDHFEILEKSLAYMGTWVMPYPYETLTMVSPPTGDTFSGGMEYPTFITIGTSYHRQKRSLRLKELIAHEFVHQYFHGLIGSNEFEEAWLDEGFTTYFEDRILHDTWGTNPTNGYLSYWHLPTIPGFNRGSGMAFWHLTYRYQNTSWLYGIAEPTTMERTQSRVLGYKTHTPISHASYQDPHYLFNAYYKPGLLLHQLERELGKDMMARVMRSYMDAWAWGHPSGKDFQRHVEAVTESSMDWFFEPLLNGQAKLDFGIRVLTNDPIVGGWVKGEDGMTFELDSDEAVKGQQVQVTNQGPEDYPVDILVTFSDGSEFRDRWDGVGSVKRWNFPIEPAIQTAVVDPDNKLLFEDKKLNNSYMANRNRAAVKPWMTRFKGYLQQYLISLAGGL